MEGRYRRFERPLVQGSVLHVLRTISGSRASTMCTTPPRTSGRAASRWRCRAITRSPALSTARSTSSAVAPATAFILSATNTDVVEEYNPVADMWSAPKERMPTARSGGGYGTDGRRIYCAGGEVTTKELVGAFRAIEAYEPADQFLDDAALHADAASWRCGRGDRQSLSPGERDDHVGRRDGDARPEARSPHGVTRRVGAAVQSDSSDGCDERAGSLAGRPSERARAKLVDRERTRDERRRRRLPRARRSSPRATTSTAPRAK